MRALFLKEGRWFDQESGLEVINPEDFISQNCLEGEKKRWWFVKDSLYTPADPGVLYPWDGGVETELLVRIKGPNSIWSKIDITEAELGVGAAWESKKVLRLLPRSPVTTKGERGGLCNRTSCQAPGALWYNHSTQKYYCTGCATLINEHNHADAMRMYGHALCTLDSFAKGGIAAIGVPECGDI